MSSCVFCEIAAGTAPASIVYADELVLAFCDIMPFTLGHALVIPRRHAAGLSDVDGAGAARMFAVGQQVAAAARRALGCPGVNLFVADGAEAWQTVYHLHLHVIPRWGRADRMKLVARPTRPARAELDRTAAQLASGLSSPSS
jgi:diadenosine tetraphosphate (Ap4A) HIT family hydrolase